MAQRVGVFLCECGPNIKENLHFEKLADEVRSLPQVAFVRESRLFCSLLEQDIMAEDIREQTLDKVVFAGCSPREHELTFQKVMERAGLNPFALQVANIREQCAWVIKDKDVATDHALEIIEAAVQRVLLHEPLKPKTISVCPDVLVVGAGVAGLSAALTLAQKARQVFLVEKSSAIGGQLMRFEKLGPNMECSSCMLEPLMDKVMHNERIRLITAAEVENVVGYFGNFTVTVRQKARSVDVQACIGCGACLPVCPVEVPNEYTRGADARHAMHYPFRGAQPNVPIIDRASCLRFTKGDDCRLCEQACPFGAVKYEEADQLFPLNVGGIVLATGAAAFDARQAPQYNYGTIPNVLTDMDLEYRLNTSGFTEGKVRLANGATPQKIAILHCVGSKSEKFNSHCSGTCCLSSLKLAHLLRHQLPEAEINEIVVDWSLPDKNAQAFFQKVQKEDSIRFFRVNSMDEVRVEKSGQKMAVKGPGLDGALNGVDLVVLSVAQKGGADAQRLAEVFDVSTDALGFFQEAHAKLDPSSTTHHGVHIAGCAQWPKSVEASVAQAQAAAGIILSQLVPGETLEMNPCVAAVQEAACSGCKMCLSLCPYHAISWVNDGKKALISDVLCQGCGVCVSSCPSGAIEGRHFTDSQILAEIKAFLAA